MIRGDIVGDRETVARLEAGKARALGAAKQSIVRLTLELLAKVKRDKLTGQVLNVRTGRLRRSINQRVVSESNSVHGYVGTNVEYARRHELGFTGPEQVKDHLRLARKAFGKDLKFPVWQTVKSHTRNVNYPPRSFLRSALSDMEPRIRADIEAAVQREFRGRL